MTYLERYNGNMADRTLEQTGRGWQSERSLMNQMRNALQSLERQIWKPKDAVETRKDSWGREYSRLTSEGKAQVERLWEQFEKSDGQGLAGWEKEVASREFWKENLLEDEKFTQLAKREFGKKIREQEEKEFLAEIEEDENSTWHETWQELKEKYKDKRSLKAAAKRLFKIREESRNAIVTNSENPGASLVLGGRVLEEMGRRAGYYVEESLNRRVKNEINEEVQMRMENAETEMLRITDKHVANEQLGNTTGVMIAALVSVYIVCGYAGDIRWELREKNVQPEASVPVNVPTVNTAWETKTPEATVTVTKTPQPKWTTTPVATDQGEWKLIPTLDGPPSGPGFHPDYVVGSLDLNEPADLKIRVPDLGVNFQTTAKANFEQKQLDKELNDWFEQFSNPHKLIIMRSGIHNHTIAFIHSYMDTIYGGEHDGNWMRKNKPKDLVGKQMVIQKGKGENTIEQTGKIVSVKYVSEEEWNKAMVWGADKYDPARFVLGKETIKQISEEGEASDVEVGLGLPEVAQGEDQITFVACAGMDPKGNLTKRVLVTVQLEK